MNKLTMKYMNKLTWSLILCTGLFTACSDDDEPVGPGEIAVDKTEIAVDQKEARS